MKIELQNKTKIKRPPTDICVFNNKIYISTKGNKVFYFGPSTQVKSILFTSQVNSLSSNSELLYASQKNGTVFALNILHKTIYKINTGESPCINSIINKDNNDLYIGSEAKKISLFSDSAILKNSFYFTEGKLCCFDISIDNVIAKCFHNDNNVYFSNDRLLDNQITNNKKTIDCTIKDSNTKARVPLQSNSSSFKDSFIIKIMDGYPEIIKFLTEDSIIIGTSTGVLSCFSRITKKRISFVKFNKGITAIYILSPFRFLIGIPNEIVLVDFSNFNKMEIADKLEVDGIPIGFCKDKSIFCALSRESRLGRWTKAKDGHNQVLELKIQ